MTTKQAIKKAKKDANKIKIESTAEGKSYLRARYQYYINK